MHFLKIHGRQLLLLISLPALLGLNILAGPFQFDDNEFIVEGFQTYRIKDIGTFEIFLREGGYFQRSVHWATLVVNFQLGGLNPYGYHLFNNLLHILNGIILFFACGRLVSILRDKIGASAFGKISVPLFPLFSSLVFLLLPIHTESTSYISGRSSALVTFFYLSGILFFLIFLAHRQNRFHFTKQLFPLCGIFCCVLLGLGTKKTFMTFPLVLLVIYFLHLKISLGLFIRKNRWLLAAILLVAFSVLGTRVHNVYQSYQEQPNHWEKGFAFEHGKGYVETRAEYFLKRGMYKVFGLGAGYDPVMDSPFSYLLTQLHVVTQYYLVKLLFPFQLNVQPDVIPIKKPDWGTLVAFFSVLLILVTAWRTAYSHPIIALSALWFFIVLLPTSSFLPLFDLASEHRTYIASPGLSMLCGFFLTWLAVKKVSCSLLPLKRTLPLTIFLCFGVAVMHRNVVWQTEIGLWADAAYKSPRSPRCHHNLGLAYARKELTSKAILEYTKALRLAPDATDTHHNLASAYKSLNLMDKAIQSYNTVIALNPRMVAAYFSLGVLYQEQGKDEKAAAFYKKAISIQKEHPGAYNNLGQVYLKQNRLSEAKACFESALAIKPFHADSLNNLGSLFLREGDLKKAEFYYQKVLSHNPFMPEIRLNLSFLYRAQGRLEESEQQYREAVRLNPEIQAAYPR